MGTGAISRHLHQNMLDITIAMAGGAVVMAARTVKSAVVRQA